MSLAFLQMKIPFKRECQVHGRTIDFVLEDGTLIEFDGDFHEDMR